MGQRAENPKDGWTHIADIARELHGDGTLSLDPSRPKQTKIITLRIDPNGCVEIEVRVTP